MKTYLAKPAAILYLALSGCGGGGDDPGSQGDGGNFTRSDQSLKVALSQAASMRKGLYRFLQNSAGVDGSGLFSDYPCLTTFALLTPPQPPEGKAYDITRIQGELPLLAALLRDVAGAREDPEYVSIIRPEYITSLHWKKLGDGEITGTVEFKAPSYQAKLPFTGNEVGSSISNTGWFIREFHLPVQKLRLTRAAPGAVWEMVPDE